MISVLMIRMYCFFSNDHFLPDSNNGSIRLFISRVLRERPQNNLFELFNKSVLTFKTNVCLRIIHYLKPQT